MPAVITFLNVIFFKKLFESVSTGIRNRSYFRIFREELADISGIIDLTFQKLWIRYYVTPILFGIWRREIPVFQAIPVISFQSIFFDRNGSLKTWWITLLSLCILSELAEACCCKELSDKNKDGRRWACSELVFSIAFLSSNIFVFNLPFASWYLIGSDYISLSDPSSASGLLESPRCPFRDHGHCHCHVFPDHNFCSLISYNKLMCKAARRAEAFGTIWRSAILTNILILWRIFW